MTQPTEFLAATALGIGALAVLAAAIIRQGTGRIEPATTQPPPHPDLWLPCHTTRCGHMSTIHDPTPTGHVCRDCGTTNGGRQ